MKVHVGESEAGIWAGVIAELSWETAVALKCAPTLPKHCGLRPEFTCDSDELGYTIRCSNPSCGADVHAKTSDAAEEMWHTLAGVAMHHCGCQPDIDLSVIGKITIRCGSSKCRLSMTKRMSLKSDAIVDVVAEWNKKCTAQTVWSQIGGALNDESKFRQPREKQRQLSE